MKKTKTLIASAILAASFGAMQVYAANVPAGVQLAKDQVLVKGGEGEPQTIDPQKVSGTPGSLRDRDLFEGLYSEGKDGVLVPGVAESYTVNKDHTVYTFKLRHDAKWSDGSPVTAEDFVFGFQRLVDPKTASTYSYYAALAGIKNAQNIIDGKDKVSSLGVKALDAHTFQVTLDHSVPYFVKMTVNASLFPAPKKVVEKWGDAWTKPEHIVSNGAYKLKSWVVNQKMVFVRNHDYWNDKKTVINKVIVLPIIDPSVEYNRYMAGDLDMTSNQGIPTNRYHELLKNVPNQVKVTPALAVYYYDFNNQKPPFNDVRVRKALSYAIDRNIITKYVTGTGEIPAYSFTPPDVAGFKAKEPQYEKWTQAERNKKAQELLKAAGFDKSHPLNFTLLYNTNENHKKIAIAISAMWKKTLGVNVTLDNQEWKTFLNTRQLGNYQVARDGWFGDYNEASTFLSLLDSNSSQNNAKYKNPAFDKLMDETAKVNNPAPYYQKAEDLAIDQDMAVAPIYQYVTKRLLKPYVGGYMPNLEDNIYTRDMYIIKH
ncbi:Periplasmic oligopeptide-binding protein precursor [Marinomonas spartinae]|uniref:ABC transporter substrate-binding protein n=1 Tax=Marinomonas spartinae TaxID=1792290 RepID=UPI000808D1B1|nr:ABC transporter substrate-binding protein [Marinomonas spartinae]SBS25248.1 Periplasmic oligopeptide-binding protein precursor [Marinomonas spartinae]